tara:strand:+ start:128 stop:751 length:624 start_codon:yes stop_codon:yes gene_type:complete
MSYRVRRKFTSSKFCIDGQLCKVFLEPKCEYEKGFYLWNAGFAVGKSNRQLNDWYKGKKNKRARSLKGKLIGKSGLKTLKKAYEELFRLRWTIEPGDTILTKCTSNKSSKQFYALWRWFSRHSDIRVDFESKSYYWYRPPYPYDAVWKNFKIIPLVPDDPLTVIEGSQYFECFRLRPKVPCTDLSMEQITDLLSQALAIEPCVEKPI